ncbi:MAG TPA: hypothetical protein VIW69_02730 [Candidatus Elarobacter sp.]
MKGSDLFLSGHEASFELRIDFDRIGSTEDDVQWLTCHCSCTVEPFHAEFPLSVTRQDFEQFQAQLSRLSSGEATEIELENLELDFRLNLAVRPTGAVTVSGKLTPGYTRTRATLEFAFDSDLASVDSATRRIGAALASLKRLA